MTNIDAVWVCGLVLKWLERFGERGRNRTCDPRLKRALLYQLSYAPSPFCICQLINGLLEIPGASPEQLVSASVLVSVGFPGQRKTV
jgi:hypothetical protein